MARLIFLFCKTASVTWASELHSKIKVISFNLGSAHGWVGRHEQCTKECREDEKQKQTKNRREDKRLYYQRGFKTLQLLLVCHRHLSYWHALLYYELIYRTREKKKRHVVRTWLEVILLSQGSNVVKHAVDFKNRQIATGHSKSYTNLPTGYLLFKKLL